MYMVLVRRSTASAVMNGSLSLTDVTMSDTDDEPSIVVLHSDSGEELGAIYFDEDGFSFESEDDDYFSDVDADTDEASFIEQLYQALKAGLPLFELDLEHEDEDA